MLGLRLAAGVENVGLARRFVESGPGRSLLDAEVIAIEHGRLFVVKPMLTDAVVREALSVSAGDC